MSQPNYTLDIISHHPKFEKKSLKKYYVDGIETVGAWGDEPFEILFKNNTYQKIQVKLSIDGTDILSGKLADTEVSKNMWVVNGYSTLALKAWPEDHNGGAGFVFTSADNSVAVHTHGNLSSRGIVAAAVFTEGHVEPSTITWLTSPPIQIQEHHYHSYPNYPYYGPVWGTTAAGLGNSGGTFTSNCGGVYANNSYSAEQTSLSQNQNSCGFNSIISNSIGVDSFGEVEIAEAPAAASNITRSRKSVEKLVSVGAGQHVDQKITYVTGLIKPQLAETIRMRYLWWDELQEKLASQTKAEAHPSGFPATEKKGIDLKGTPRIKGQNTPARVRAPAFTRV